MIEMDPYLYDRELYQLLPIEDRLWMNKLYLAERLGYICGPCGSNAPAGEWVVRPIQNLGGMGAGGFYKFVVETTGVNDTVKNRPGYFWSEWFEGKSRFSEFIDDKPTYSYVSELDLKDIPIGGEKHWLESTDHIVLPDMIKGVSKFMTLEAIDDKIIEVTFRLIPDWGRKITVANYRATHPDYEAENVIYGMPIYRRVPSKTWIEKGDSWEEIIDSRRQFSE